VNRNDIYVVFEKFIQKNPARDDRIIVGAIHELYSSKHEGIKDL
jgi:hypothetical protein